MKDDYLQLITKNIDIILHGNPSEVDLNIDEDFTRNNINNNVNKHNDVLIEDESKKIGIDAPSNCTKCSEKQVTIGTNENVNTLGLNINEDDSLSNLLALIASEKDEVINNHRQDNGWFFQKRVTPQLISKVQKKKTRIK